MINIEKERSKERENSEKNKGNKRIVDDEGEGQVE